jgi:DNA-binding ferritin-like protein
LRTFQPERALIARETHEENRKDLAKMLDQIAMERAARLPPPIPQLSLEAQIQESIRKTRENVQRAKDAQTADILRWLQS